MRATWTKEQRDQLLRAFEKASDALVAAARTREDEVLLNALRNEDDRLQQAYWDGLPCQTLSRCPRCDQALDKAFDPWGLDGLFWQENLSLRPAEPAPCPHFAVLLGAVHLNGLPPKGGRAEAHPGPEAPYVVPRLLALPGMTAVLSSIPMANGYTAYPIAYFADPMPKPSLLTQPWTKRSFSFESEGELAWTEKNETWDFDLEPWIASGVLRWIAPGDPDFRIVAPPASPPAPCPYVGLPGRRIGLTVKKDSAWPK